MSRMFKNVATWNPVTGCSHGCTYCWAAKLARTRLKNNPRYKDGFDKYQLHAKEFKPLKEHTTYFVCAMGDLWAEGCPQAYGEAVFTFLESETGPEGEPNCPDTTTLLFLTKNPAMYLQQWPKGIEPPENYILGATIESNRFAPGGRLFWVKAPNPTDRIFAMMEFREIHPNARLFISIEPIMEFDLDAFIKAIKAIRPEWIYIGLDNHHSKLPEPTEKEIWELVYESSEFTEPRIKGKLRR